MIKDYFCYNDECKLHIKLSINCAPVILSYELKDDCIATERRKLEYGDFGYVYLCDDCMKLAEEKKLTKCTINIVNKPRELGG